MATVESIVSICTEVEKADSRPALVGALRRFNDIFNMLVEAAPGKAKENLVREALIS